MAYPVELIVDGTWVDDYEDWEPDRLGEDILLAISDGANKVYVERVVPRFIVFSIAVRDNSTHKQGHFTEIKRVTTRKEAEKEVQSARDNIWTIEKLGQETYYYGYKED